MRELLLIGIVALICLAGLLNPKLGLFGYLWFGLMRPDVLAWSYGEHPYSLAIAICVLLGSVRYAPNVVAWFKNPICLGFLALAAIMIASAFLAVNPSLAMPELNLFVRILVMALLIPMLIQTRQEFLWLLLVIGGSLGLLGVKFGLYGVYHGGVRFGAGYGGFMSEGNSLALALAMSVPICWFARHLFQWRWLRHMLVAVVFFSSAGIVMTYSRGGALSLAAALALLVWHSRRRLLVGISVATLTVPLILLTVASQSYLRRWQFLETGDLDASARSRVDLAVAAVKMWRDHPLLGVGYGATNYVALSPAYLGRPNYHVAHNTYLQMLVDSGIFAFLLYLALLFGVIVWLGRSGKALRRVSEPLQYYAYALRGSLIVFAVGSFFGSRTNYDLLYILLMSAAAWYPIQKSLRTPAGESTAAAETPIQSGRAIRPPVSSAIAAAPLPSQVLRSRPRASEQLRRAHGPRAVRAQPRKTQSKNS